MTARQAPEESITIVGGRPMETSVDVRLLPQGVEQVLTLAALDEGFRRQLALDPCTAAQSRCLDLDPIETRLLRIMKPEGLARMSECLVIPPSGHRNGFCKAVSSSVIAMVTGAAMLVCGGCAGGSSGGISPQIQPGANQLWMSLGGHTCYVYLPASSVAAPSVPRPVLVALHDQGETCLANVQRWHRAADALGFNLVSVNWTEEAPTPERQVQLVGDLTRILEDFDKRYRVDPAQRYLCGRGASTPLAWKATFLPPHPSRFRRVIFLGGVPEGDWKTSSDALLQDIHPMPPALNHIVGKADPEYAQVVALAGALGRRNVPHVLTEREGTLTQATLDFSELGRWMMAAN